MTKDLLQVVHATSYPLDAFVFVQRGLDFTVRRIHGEPDSQTDLGNRHITGTMLCHGLRDYATKQYGLMACTVLNHWNIHGCQDFGQIVFALVDAGLMHKTDDDSLDDFAGVYDFAQAFSAQFQLSENT